MHSFADIAAQQVVSEVRKRHGMTDRPFLIAVDGGSGSGKSTVALLIAAELKAAYVAGDDFFAADITDEGWGQRSHETRAADAIDWRRLRRDVLEPLAKRQKARWQAFDFVSGVNPDGTYNLLPAFTELMPADFVVLDGAYSSRPEFADLIDLSVLVDVPAAERHRRLTLREDKAFLDAWHTRWDDAESHYFSNVRPPAHFDLIVSNVLGEPSKISRAAPASEKPMP